MEEHVVSDPPITEEKSLPPLALIGSRTHFRRSVPFKFIPVLVSEMVELDFQMAKLTCNYMNMYYEVQHCDLWATCNNMFSDFRFSFLSIETFLFKINVVHKIILQNALYHFYTTLTWTDFSMILYITRSAILFHWFTSCFLYILVYRIICIVYVYGYNIHHKQNT